MNDRPPFYQLEGYPAQVTGTSVLTRLLDALGFRFHWATKGLTDEDYAFSPGQGSMDIAHLVEHIWGLVNWVSTTILGQGEERPEPPQAQCAHALQMLHRLREHVATLDDETLDAIKIRGLPFWHILNGPLADALTHVGQINTLRRLNGNPTPKASVFMGKPPADSQR